MSAAVAPALPWSVRRIESAGVSLLVVAVAVALGWAALMLVALNLAGALDGVRIGDQPFWLHPFGVIGISYPPLMGYAVVFPSLVLRSANANLRRLRPILKAPAPELEVRDLDLAFFSGRQLRIVGGAGLLSIILLDPLVYLNFPEASRPQPWAIWICAAMAMDLFMAWFLFRALLIAVQTARALSRVGDGQVRIDLFDLGPVTPFTAFGTRLSLFVLLGVGLSLPLFVPLGLIEDAGLEILVTLLMFLPMPFLITAVVLPLRGVHRNIVREKRGELERVRAEIEREREAVFGPDEERKTRAGLRLPGLLAYEGRVERVREWPFDLPALLRLAVYALIPLGSWIAAALVERALGSALG